MNGAGVSDIFEFFATFMSLERFTLFALMVSLAASACGGQGQSAPGAGGAAPGAFPPIEVKTVTLEAKPVPQSTEYLATIESLRSTTVQPQIEGLVRQLFVRSGDRVRAGQPIVQIDPDRQEAEVSATESQRAAREADLELATQQLARMRKLHEAGAVSGADLDQAESAYKTAVAQLAVVRSQIRESQLELQYYRVTAPTPGVVGDIPIRVGDRVTPATIITTIDQAEGLEAYVNVPLERGMDLKQGLALELLDSRGTVVASNPVTFIASRADDATQTVLVKATLRRMPPGLRVMQSVRARLIWSIDSGLVVPVLSVSRVAGQYFVFVAESSERGFVARQKAIVLGDVIGDAYIVRSGLKAGERVIVSNVQKIGDGAPVKPS
jgi:RND family efflux transporter MFP subunit